MRESREQAPEAARAPADAEKYLTFYADGQRYGLPITHVVQIISLPEITPVPDAPAYMKGIAGLRGAVLPLMDVRLRLGRTETPHTDRTCVIVTALGERTFGCIVDMVDEVTDIAREAVSPPPAQGREGACLSGVARLGERIILLIDPARILRKEQLEAMTRAAT